MGVLNGLLMELDDCAFPLVKKVIATADPLEAFKVISDFTYTFRFFVLILTGNPYQYCKLPSRVFGPHLHGPICHILPFGRGTLL